MAETWNANNPALTNQIRGDVADIEENLDYLMHRFGYRVDSAEADQGATGNGGSIKALLDTIGTTKMAALFFPHHMKDGNTTTYNLDTTYDASSYDNVTFVFQHGAQIDGVTGDETITFPSPENIQASLRQQIFGSSLTVSFTQKAGWVSPFWWGAVFDPGDDSTDSGEEIQAAIDTGANVRVPRGTYSTDSAIVQDNDQQMIDVQGVFLRVNADVIGWQLGTTGGGTQNARMKLFGGLRVENVSGSSTEAGVRLESAAYSDVEIDYVKGFNFGIELTSSGSKGCVYNDIRAGYIHVNDSTDGYGVYFNHVDGVNGYVYNNDVHFPYITGGTYKYGIYVRYKSSGSNPSPMNNRVLHLVSGGTADYVVYDDGKSTRIEGGHFELTSNNTITLDTAADYKWTQVGATNEYYLELNAGGNPWTKGNLGFGLSLGSGDTVSESGYGDLSWGAVGSLASGRFGWGDPDGNGWNTLVVRTSDDTQPANDEISFVDPSLVALGSNSSNAEIDITHHNVTRATIHGDYYKISTRDMLMQEFQDGNNVGTLMYFKRVGVQSYAEATPMMELYDSNSAGTTYSQVLRTRAGETDANSFHLQGMDGSDNEKYKIDGAGDISHVGSHIPGSVVSTISANGTFAPTDGNVFARNNDSGGSVNLNPSGTFSAGHWIILIETGGANAIVFDSTGLNATVAAGKMGIFTYDGSNWQGSQVN